MLLSEAIARYLDSQELLTFDPAGASGDTFIDVVPAAPDELVVITEYPGPQPEMLGYDRPRLQFRFRAGRDPRTARGRAANIYNELQALRHVTLENGTWLIACYALQPVPQSLGLDPSNRLEYSQNYEFYIRNQTKHRP